MFMTNHAERPQYFIRTNPEHEIPAAPRRRRGSEGYRSYTQETKDYCRRSLRYGVDREILAWAADVHPESLRRWAVHWGLIITAPKGRAHTGTSNLVLNHAEAS